RDDLGLRGIKGTTGTHANFLAVFDRDHKKVEQLDELATKLSGFECACPVTGQTYDAVNTALKGKDTGPKSGSIFAAFSLQAKGTVLKV
ncbi:hypothetical protein SCLCIDRAFT_1225443, partial [Scleroderma citrinum Foug A]